MNIIEYVNKLNSKSKRYRVVEEYIVNHNEIYKQSLKGIEIKEKIQTKVLLDTDDIEEAKQKVEEVGGFAIPYKRDNRYYLYFCKNCLIKFYKIIDLERKNE